MFFPSAGGRASAPSAPTLPDGVYSIYHRGGLGGYAGFLFHCYSRALSTPSDSIKAVAMS